MANEFVILVDENDQIIGEMEKMEAHQSGSLHRAFSVFIFNSKGYMLLQQRALNKYHSPGLWTNACCSHPRPGEETLDAANRRLMEEMGMKVALELKNHFIYKSSEEASGFENGLIEHEFDYVFTGTSDKDPIINKEEVAAYQWKSIEEIEKDLMAHPHQYTFWFKIAFEKFFKLKSL
ncbi:MAG: isopentenyl-diphosphate Delta-isomerase [Sphingobacteriaceae bacterium]|nr:isopentenyl-diphosphate Delta-isomerase [Sphingobacteriaceae bacterium]